MESARHANSQWSRCCREMADQASKTPKARRGPAHWIATVLGVGSLPRAPGTWGSIAALPPAWLILEAGGPWGLLAATAAIFVVGWWASATTVRDIGDKDPGFIVIDEVAGQWLALVPMPLDPIAFAVGFVLFRVTDILKPWPVSWADRSVPGGLGVMLDDMFAGGYVALAGLAFWGLKSV